MADMISGVVVVKSASMADETIPIPYCGVLWPYLSSFERLD
ncbi:hypothetical protein [Campylobacter concisus]